MRKVAWCYNTFIQGLPLKTNRKENYNISLNLIKEMKLYHITEIISYIFFNWEDQETLCLVAVFGYVFSFNKFYSSIIQNNILNIL